MNIYFSCSITGGRQDQYVYQAIKEILVSYGHEVPTAHLADADVMDFEDTIPADQIFLRDCGWVSGCDALVAEVSTPSHGVGYEIALALSLKKPVFCCYRKGVRVSKMLIGNTTPGYLLCAYSSLDELRGALLIYLETIRKR